MGFITAIGTATPPHKLSQSQIADFMVKAMALNEQDERRLRAVFRSSGIQSRHSILADYGKKESFDFFPDSHNLEPFPSTSQRAASFKQHALNLSVAAVQNMNGGEQQLQAATITHLITVSCTGMYAPGLDLELVEALNLPTHVQRTCINFMGCYAAINAIRLADTICSADGNARVLIVCTELCSLHFQKEISHDNFLANALFADGSAALLITSHFNGKAIGLEKFYCDIVSEGNKDMAWEIGDHGFKMKLSGYIPSLIKDGIAQFADTLLKKISMPMSAIKYFAVHPGGKKILEAIAVALDLPLEKLASSYNVLSNYGNMSSPSVVFVLDQLWKNAVEEDHDASILTFAFGPGLTMESIAMKMKMHAE